MTATELYPSQCKLAEGPVWDNSKKCCYWVDIDGYTLFEYQWNTRTVKKRKFDQKPGMLALSENNTLIIALNRSIARYHTESETLEMLLEVEPGNTANRFNDGKCDTKGRLWIGTMHMEFKPYTGSFYCIDKDLKPIKYLDQLTISNGMAWSPDNKRLYFIDSPKQTIESYLFNAESGEIVFEKIAVHIPKELGTPDGMTIDTEGMLWVAHWGGFGVYRWDPVNDILLNKIDLPVPNITSCTFAGDLLDILVITTAQGDLNEEELKKYPQSGNIFYFKTAFKGFLANKCLI